MKKIVPIFAILIALFFACNGEDSTNLENANSSASQVTLNFEHTWEETPVTNAAFNTIQFTNANGEAMSITRLRYLISNITFTKATGERIVIDGYNLVDVTNTTNLEQIISEVPHGNYTNVSFTFGLDNAANYNNNYQDLNTAVWNVPDILGGGYHYMQLEGKYIADDATEKGYVYHAIRAVDITGDTPRFEDTFFTVNLGAVNITKETELTVEMDVAEWFKTPNTWDLNELDTMLMPNFNAQLLMYENGQNVFRLIDIY